MILCDIFYSSLCGFTSCPSSAKMRRGIYIGTIVLLFLASLCSCRALDEDITDDAKIDSVKAAAGQEVSLEERQSGDEKTTTTTTQKPPHHAPVAHNPDDKNRFYSVGSFTFLAIVAGCSVAGLIGLVVAGVCWYRFQKDVKAASEAEYPAYGITGPNKERIQSPGDRKLAQSAQMYHYQHQKQQMIALEKANGEMKHDASDEDSEEENEEGDYTVYECPGLAPTGEMEVKNPLFSEDNNHGPGSDASLHRDVEAHSLK